MAKAKFHINGSGDVKPCNASVRTCRFSDAEHFENKQEAAVYAERMLSEAYSEQSSTSLKKNSAFKKSIDEVLEQNKSISPESLMRIGQVFDNELQKRLDFDIYGDLSNDDLLNIEKETHKMMSEIMDIGAPLKNDLYGTMSDKLNKAVSVLPNSVKDSLKNTDILAKAIRKDAMDRDGQHMGNARFKIVEKSSGKKASEYVLNKVKDLDDGTFYIDDMVWSGDLESDYWGSKAYVKRDGTDVHDEIWIGRPIKGSKNVGKKISDKSMVFVNGKMMEIDKPIYEYRYEVTRTGSVISAKKTDFESDQNSVLLHEYVHLVQQYDYTPSEPEMFNKLRESDSPSYRSGLGEACYDGFPDEYMGLHNSRELLTRATEGLYYPSAHSSQFLYGKNRGKNADKVRQWVAGYWLNRDRTTR